MSVVKVVGIYGSPRRHGDSSRLLDAALDAAETEGAEVRRIRLADIELEHCSGCRRCLNEGSCVLEDDLEMIRGEMMAADAVALASPTHGLAPSGRMKVMMDRIGLSGVYTSELEGTYVMALATAGGFGAKSVAKQLTKVCDGFFGRGLVVGSMGVIVGIGMKADDPAIARAAILGRKLVTEVKAGRRYPTQRLYSRTLQVLFLRRAAKRNVIENREHMEHIHRVLTEKGIL